MSDISDFSDSEGNDKHLIFVKKLKEYKILFNKSQVPQIKKEKEVSLEALTQEYGKIFNVSLTTKQVAKKICNMKSEVKKKFDMTRTGNKKITYKPWEKILMDILDAEKNPVFAKVPGAVSIGVNEFPVTQERPSLNLPPETMPLITPLKRKSNNFLSETSETKNLSNPELQRLVMLEQLELIRLQKDRERAKLDLIKAEKDKISASTESNETYFTNL